MFGGLALHWRVIVLVVVLLLAMALVGQCLMRERSSEGRTVGEASVGDARQVRPPSEEELIERYGLSDRDFERNLDVDGYLRDPVDPGELPPGTEERFAETYVDTIGPPVPEGESARFVFDIEEVRGPRSFSEAFGGERRPRTGDDEAGDRLDEASRWQVVTVRGRVRNITRRDCRLLIFKASYRGEDGTIHAIGEARVRGVQAQSRQGTQFEVHLTDWPQGIESPRPQGFRLYESDSHWDWDY